MERITKSQYIFEGEVVRSNGYWNDDKNYIYTSLTIDIYKIFKGNLVCGKVELINEGGKVADTVELQISHNLILKVGQKGIFLCRETSKELPTIDYYPEENYQKLETTFNEQGYIKYFEDNINPELWDYQFSLDSLAQVYNLMEVYTQLNYVDCYPGQVVFPSVKPNTRRMQSPEAHSSIPLNISATTGDTNITFTLQNPQLSYSNGHRYFEFDFSISDSTSGVYFTQLIAKITYDTLTFGKNIGGTSRIDVTRGVITSDSISYNEPHSTNYRSNILSLVVGIPLPLTHTYIDLSETPQSVAHIKMQIDDCGMPSIIHQTVVTVFAKYSLQEHMGTSQTSYDTINVVNDLSFGGCTNGNSSYITSISPFHVRAGVGDTVTLNGRGFGAIKGNGNIFLPNADNGGSTFVHLDSVDYIYPWTDTILKFVVPSNMDNSNPDYDTPGSGLLYVQNDSGFSIGTIQDSLIIDYGIINSYPRQRINKYFPYLSGTDTSRGFIFRPDTNFTHYSNRLIALDAAIKSWSCLTTINFKLGTELQTTDSIGLFNSICTIKIGYDTNSAVIGRSNVWLGFQPGCEKAFLKEMDITFNRAYTYFADTTSTQSVPSNEVDLYQVLLHELGHCHLLTHVNDTNAIMWWGTRTNDTSAANRKLTLYNDLAALNGGSYVISKAYQIDTINCPFFLLESGSTNCTNVIGIEDVIKPEINLLTYPNPASIYLNISLQSEKHSNINITITDLTGRKIIYIKDKASGNYNTSIPIYYLENGLYLIQLELRGYTYLSKIIKQ